MNAAAQLIKIASKKARKGRAEMFRKTFSFDSKTKILDLGSEDGSNIAFIVDSLSIKPKNVFIADIETSKLEIGHKKFGFTPVLLDQSGSLPYPDQFFDLVYCSSVIEHVTVPKEQVWNRKIAFEQISKQHQKAFAAEIIRVGKQYFVQTPSKNFPIESHSWLPLVNFLPRRALIPLLRLTNSFWIKQTIPDFHLLGQKEVTKLFPGAKIVTEKKFGLVKSIMAIKVVIAEGRGQQAE